MKRRAAVAASCFAVLVPIGVLLVDRGGSGGRGASCAVRYSSTGARLTVALEQAGSIEVRAGGSDTRLTEPAGTSVLTLPSPVPPAAVSVTEFTADGQLIVCAVASGG